MLLLLLLLVPLGISVSITPTLRKYIIALASKKPKIQTRAKKRETKIMLKKKEKKICGRRATPGCSSTFVYKKISNFIF